MFRVEMLVNVAEFGTDTLMDNCDLMLLDPSTSGIEGNKCGFQYKQYQCYPNNILLENKEINI